MSEKDLEKTARNYFSLNPKEYADSYSKETAEGYSFRVRKDRVLELLGYGPGRVLDIGCGPAVMTKEITDRGFTYDGIDISEVMIGEAKKKFPAASFSVGAVENISAPNNAYDVIVAMGLVEYVTDDSAAIREMQRVLKPGGRLLVSLPNWWSPMRMWDRLIIALLGSFIRRFRQKLGENIFHREYRPHAYMKTLEKEGFTIKNPTAYNFRILPRPFDYWFPKLSIITATLLEPLRLTPLRFLGTGVILEAVRKRSQ